MSFPIIQNATAGSNSTNTTDHSIVMPSGIQIGNLIIVFIAVDGNVKLFIDTAISGEDWTEAVETSTANLTIGLYWKIAAGDSTDALQITSDYSQMSSYISLTINNYLMGNPIRVSSSASGSSTNMNPPSLAPTYGANDYLWFVFGGIDNDLVATAAPTGFSDLRTSICNSTEGVGCSIASRQYNTGSSYDPPVFTSPNGPWVTCTVLINPLEASGISIPMFAYYNF